MTIQSYLESDHRRLEALLTKAASSPGTIDRKAYDDFRQGLLAHIGIEEKLLLPEAQKIRGGQALARAAKLRLDHGAIAALLVLEPTPNVIRALEVILEAHNPLEEGPGGVYAECEELLGESAAELLEKMRQYPPVPVAKRMQSEALISAAKRCMERAGFSGGLLD